MSGSEPTQPTPEPSSGPTPVGSAPARAPASAAESAPAQPQGAPQADAPPADVPQQPAAPATPPELPTAPPPGRLAALKGLASSGKALWAAAAIVLAAIGIVASLLGARAIRNNDVEANRRGFQTTSADITSHLRQAVQQEENLIVSASTFFAGNPKPSPAAFEKWATWAQLARRYPELNRLALIAPVTPPTTVVPPVRGTAATTRPTAARVIKGPERCLALTGISSGGRFAPSSSLDYCAATPALRATRASGAILSSHVTVGGQEALRTYTPVYKGGPAPAGSAARSSAFVGWLRQVLVPAVVLEGALQGHASHAVRVRYHRGASSFVFTAGPAPAAEAQSAKATLGNGWGARVFGPAAGIDLLSDEKALILLIGGVLVSVLLGVLVFVLGGGLPRARPRALAHARQAPEVPHEDLYDPLTGLPNRALTLDRAERMVARAGRQSGLVAGALFVDVDWFKDVNDKLGEAAGDQLLQIVAQRLETVVRAHDTVGRLDNHDEFVLLVESAARGVRLDSLARRVIEALHKPVELEGFRQSFLMTASIGVAFGRYASAEELLRDARLALYAAKAAGKDRYTMFNANMRSVVEGRGLLEVDLNAALQEGQFFLLYQPIFDLRSRKAVALEALIRWQHPTRGVLTPSEFIALAEETGLIVPIGRWVLEEACSRAAAWSVSGHRAGIAVKVSATQLNRDGFATDVRRALQQSGLDPSLLVLEIAEDTVMLDVAAMGERMAELKQLGVRIAVDDFGSGYAYRADLQRMPIDFLKVDRSSLAAADDDSYRSWLLEAILVFGRDLKLTVIAKAIETAEHLEAVQKMGCAMAQGMFLGQPTPPTGVERIFHMQLPLAGGGAVGSGEQIRASAGERDPERTEVPTRHDQPGPMAPLGPGTMAPLPPGVAASDQPATGSSE